MYKYLKCFLFYRPVSAIKRIKITSIKWYIILLKIPSIHVYCVVYFLYQLNGVGLRLFIYPHHMDISREEKHDLKEDCSK